MSYRTPAVDIRKLMLVHQLSLTVRFADGQVHALLHTAGSKDGIGAKGTNPTTAVTALAARLPNETITGCVSVGATMCKLPPSIDATKLLQEMAAFAPNALFFLDEHKSFHALDFMLGIAEHMNTEILWTRIGVERVMDGEWMIKLPAASLKAKASTPAQACHILATRVSGQTLRLGQCDFCLPDYGPADNVEAEATPSPLPEIYGTNGSEGIVPAV